RGARIEAHPPEREHQGSNHDVTEIVSRKGSWGAVPSVLADSRSENHRERERGPTTGGMNDSRAGEVDRAVPEMEIDSKVLQQSAVAEMRQEASAPHPVAVDRIDDCAHRNLGQEEPGEADALGDRADDDVARRLHEHDLEQEERDNADVVGVAGLQEEAVGSDDSRRTVGEQSVAWG